MPVTKNKNKERALGISGSLLAGPWVFVAVWHLIDWIGRAQTAMAITPYLAACGNSRETCDLANVSDVYTAWPWERARNGSDRKISGSSVARSWARRRMHFTIG